MRKNKKFKNHPKKEDFRYSSFLVSELINKLMFSGKKTKASNIIYKSADLIEKKTSFSFLEILDKALENSRPDLETKSRRLGGSKQRIPVKVEKKRATTLALRWIVNGARIEKNSKPMFENLANEIINASNGTGKACEKKKNLQKEAIGNMAFSGIKV